MSKVSPVMKFHFRGYGAGLSSSSINFTWAAHALFPPFKTLNIYTPCTGMDCRIRLKLVWSITLQGYFILSRGILLRLGARYFLFTMRNVGDLRAKGNSDTGWNISINLISILRTHTHNWLYKVHTTSFVVQVSWVLLKITSTIYGSLGPIQVRESNM